MAAVVGFAFLGVAVTPVGKQVFLFVVATIPNAMLCMTTTAATVQKAAFGRSKSPPLAVKKVRLTPVQKKITLFSIGRCQTDGMTQSAVFLPPKAAFFTAAGRFLNHAGCCRHAKHGVGDGGDDTEENLFSDWRHRQSPKRRSRQQPPWLFVFISTYYICR